MVGSVGGDRAASGSSAPAAATTKAPRRRTGRRRAVALVALLAVVSRLVLTVEISGTRLILDALPLPGAIDLAPVPLIVTLVDAAVLAGVEVVADAGGASLLATHPAGGARLSGTRVDAPHAAGRRLPSAVGITNGHPTPRRLSAGVGVGCHSPAADGTLVTSITTPAATPVGQEA